MKTNEHTPAFWYVEKTALGDNNVEIKILKDEPHPTHAPFWTICKVNSCMGDESEANALLIAAAPEMLAALKQVFVEMDLKSRSQFKTFAKVRAAIEKATSTASY